MIVITGAVGFIGSCLVSKLNRENYTDLLLVDDFSREDKNINVAGKVFSEKVDRKDFFEWLDENSHEVTFIFHIGARTDTAEFNMSVFDDLNLGYTKKMWKACARYQIPMVYASSAATYGLGEYGYDDNHEVVSKLQPLNPYGVSKNEFDKWALKQEERPPFWAGMKFFNVYGPNENHKSRMASVVFHAFHQINKTNGMKLFRSHRPDFEDGMQLRDFVYVKDVVDVLMFMFRTRPEDGIYNLGTGKARAFLHLAQVTFKAMDKDENIEFVDTPKDIRDKYQYFTEANMAKLRRAGYEKEFHTLEEGVTDYVQNYLMPEKLF